MPISQSLIPPAGPAWAGSLMGTSIIATLLSIHGAKSIALAFAVLATAIFIVLTCGTLYFRKPKFVPEHMGPWGMFAMGIIALGSAWTTITEDSVFQRLTYLTAGLAGFLIAGYQWRKFSGSPNFQWGLALVVPMVAATSAAQLGYYTLGRIGFIAVWIIGVPVFVYVYLALFRGRARIPALVANTAWIPVGVVGQSTAAAQLLFPANFAFTYAAVMLPLGALASLYALYHQVRALRRWVAYNPAWWGSTFPVGTMSLGTHFVAVNSGHHIFDVISQGFLALAIINWCLCLARFSTWALNYRTGSGEAK